jgi:FixJ family two-component response regulator
METLTSTVFIVDDDEAVVRALTRVLRSADFTVEPFSSPRAFLARGRHDGPACLLLDLRMPEISGLDLQQRLGVNPSLPVVFMSAYGDVGTSVQAMKAGAVDFLVKPVAAEQLLDVVTRALATSEQALVERQERNQVAARLERLTPRERQVCDLVVAGLLNKQIAADLELSEKTVKIHRGHMMHKLGVGSVAELTRLIERSHTPAPSSLPDNPAA